METIFMIVLLVLVLLFYFSNKRNKANQWCAVAGLFFWLGVEKEAVLYNIVPWLEKVLDNTTLSAAFMPWYSVQTWALYSLATPTAVIFALYFCNMDMSRPKLLCYTKLFIYVPALVLSFFFSPLEFRAYQLVSFSFWATYSVYNLIFVAAYTFFLIRGVKTETDGKKKAQKRYIRLITLPPVIFWLVSAFPTHLFEISGLYKLWEGNAIILAFCLIVLVVMAFREGFMGLKLSGQTYNWNTDMKLIGKGAEYTNHMLKNQTSKMEWCVENLKTQFDRSGEAAPEELAIISRSLSSMKNYMDKIKRHSQDITLLEESCRLADLISDAMPVSLKGQDSITTSIHIPETLTLSCDRGHMTEALSNILVNAVEAISAKGAIEITGAYSQSHYILQISDSGTGMSDEDIKNAFAPYYTTKNTETNFGLGLSYCKNVLIKHGGSISIKSNPSKGTSVSITFPVKRVSDSGSETGEK